MNNAAGASVAVDWAAAVASLARHGWARLAAALPLSTCEELEMAAPDTWTPVPEREGGGAVRQAGLGSNSAVADAPVAVGRLATTIETGINEAAVPFPPIPTFNHAQWSRANSGEKFITPHRDPPTAAGIIAVVTLRGRAPFRVWEATGTSRHVTASAEAAAEWNTELGDVVLLCGQGWPTAAASCPIHEARPMLDAERVTLTLRHNVGGYGADYFSP